MNFRAYLQPVIRKASPLLMDCVAEWGVDLDAMLWRLRPPPGWPYLRRRTGWSDDLARVSGVCARGGCLMVSLTEESLEVRAWLGDAFACTGKGELQLWLGSRIPETLQLSMVGRELDTVVSHQLLALRPYRIIRARAVGNGTVIDAEAPHVPYGLPWG